MDITKIGALGRQGRRMAGVALAVAAALAGMAWYVRRESRAVDAALPPQGEILDIDGVLVHCVSRGDGPVVVLLHGNGSRSEELESSGLVARLARDHRVLMIDRPGFGHSERPDSVDWTPSAQASLVARVLGQLGVERATVLGHSWGTLVALALALDHPRLVAALVLVSGYYYPTLRPDTLLLSMPAWPVLGTLVRNTTSPVFSRLAWPALRSIAFGPAPAPERFRQLPAWAFLRPRSLKAAAQESGMMIAQTGALAQRYGELRVPVSILAGESDRIVDPHGQVERLQRELGDAQSTTIPGAGHMLHHADPDLVADAVTEVERRAERSVGVTHALVPEVTALQPQFAVSVRAAD